MTFNVIFIACVFLVGFLYTARTTVTFKPFKVRFGRPNYALDVFGMVVLVLIIYLGGESYAKEDRKNLYREKLLLEYELQRTKDSLKDCREQNFMMGRDYELINNY